jgi:hypothetical protein
MIILRKMIHAILRSGSALASLALSGFILLGTGYLLGWTTVPTPAPLLPEAGTTPTSIVNSESSGFFGKPALGDQRRPGTVDTNSPNVTVRQTILRIAARLRPGMGEREAGALAMAEVASLNATQLKIALNELRDAPQNSSFHALRMMLVSRWIRLEPEAAYDYAVANPIANPLFLRRETMENILISMWASHDPQGALAKWRSLPEERRSSPSRTGNIIRAIGDQDFALALNTLDTLPKKYEFESLKALARSPKTEAERRTLFDRVGKLPKLRNRASIISRTLHGWARDENPEAAVAWLDNSDLPQKESQQIEISLARQWFYENHEAAADWLISRADTPAHRQESLRSMTSVWASYDALAAAEWLNRQTLDETAAPAMRTLAERIVRHHPEDAIMWVNAITVPKERRKAVEVVSRTIRKNYPQLADDLLAKL